MLYKEIQKTAAKNNMSLAEATNAVILRYNGDPSVIGTPTFLQQYSQMIKGEPIFNRPPPVPEGGLRWGSNTPESEVSSPTRWRTGASGNWGGWHGTGASDSWGNWGETGASHYWGLTDLDLAKLSQHVYGGGGPLPPGVFKVDPSKFESLGLKGLRLENRRTGFKSQLYGTTWGQYVYATAGTDGFFAFDDWESNIKQGLGLEAPQYAQAFDNAEILRKSSILRETILTGHSLGGSLASLISLRTKQQAATFNAAGLSKETLERYSVTHVNPQNLIRAYIMNGEALNTASEPAGLGAAGQHISLKHKFYDLIHRLPLARMGGPANPLSIYKHDIGLTISVMEERYKDLK